MSRSRHRHAHPLRRAADALPIAITITTAALALCAAGLWLWVVGEAYPVQRLARRDASSLRVLDGRGETLWHAATGAGGRGQWVPLSRISPALVDAMLSSEDHRFYAHAGVDPLGIARALWLNLSDSDTTYGASTLTMQLVRVLDPSIGRDLPGKLRQVVAAWRLERASDKLTILEQYLNRIYFGHGAWGAEAAARQYFAKAASELSLSEAALLATLPRSPARYNPYRHLDRALRRRRHILDAMRARKLITASAHALALEVPVRPRGDRSTRHAPHFVDHVLNQLEPGDRDRATASMDETLHTGLDLPLQEQLQLAVRRHLDAVGGRHVTQAGLLVLRHSDGAVLAMVGSRDYHDVAGDGALNVTTVRRRPGSTLKPFVYALALEAGDSPATLAYDVTLPGEHGRGYTADVRQHGPARYRESLAGSYNLAAVHTLQRVGVQPLLARLRRAGVYALDRPNASYGPGLAIGEAEFTLLQYAGAFAAFGNGGVPVTPRAILGATSAGRDERNTPQPAPAPRAVFSPAIAYQVFDILSDPDARRPMFGGRAPMALPFRVALKTGTTRAYTDNLAFGTTAEYTVGAWAGNFDGTPTHTMMAMQGAAPLVRAAFVALAARFGPPTAPARPASLFEEAVCPLSGQRPGPHCPHRKLELFSEHSRLPADARCSFHVMHCGQASVRFPPALQHWARSYGLDGGAADSDCDARPPAQLRIVYPREGARFRLDPFRDAHHQRPPLRALPADPATVWTIDGAPLAGFMPTPGPHRVRASRDGVHAAVNIHFE